MIRIPIARPTLGEQEAEAARAAILSGWVTQGPRVAEFESRFADHVGAAHAVAVSSCTAALHLSLKVAGVGPGDEVVCPSLSFVATANAVVHAGARPVFADADRDTGNLDPADAERRVTPRTRAILVVHQVGMPADIDAFHELCAGRGLALVEDAACAAGSSYGGRPIGSHSDLVCFSFHPRKVITTGDGGMITTPDAEVAARLRRLRHHGMSVSDRARHGATDLVFEDYLEVGWNYRMTDIQAAVGIVQLGRLTALVEERRRIAAEYARGFADLPFVRVPREPPDRRTNFQSYVVVLGPDCPVPRDEVMRRMLAAGVATRRGVMTAHRATAYREGCAGLRLPVSEDLSDRGLMLPLFVPMTPEEVGTVVREFRAAVKAP